VNRRSEEKEREGKRERASEIQREKGGREHSSSRLLSRLVQLLSCVYLVLYYLYLIIIIVLLLFIIIITILIAGYFLKIELNQTVSSGLAAYFDMGGTNGLWNVINLANYTVIVFFSAAHITFKKNANELGAGTVRCVLMHSCIMLSTITPHTPPLLRSLYYAQYNHVAVFPAGLP
jgi:hypothetical protein